MTKSTEFSLDASDFAEIEDSVIRHLGEGDLVLVKEELADDESFALVLVEEDSAQLDVWKQHASYDDTSAPQLFERINQAQSVLSILRACLPDVKNLEEIEEQLIQSAQHVASLTALDANLSGYEQHAAEIAADLSGFEEALLEAERRVPVSWLRLKADDRDFGDVALAHYLRFQVQYLKLTPKSWSRIDLLVSRVASRRDEDGPLLLRPPDEVADLLSACLPPSETQAEVRDAAIQFFRNAAQRLDEFDKVYEFFSSGFYVDVLGYELSLRYDYFDPPILYAATELNIAIENWLEYENEVNIRSLESEFHEAREKVRKIFSSRAGNLGSLTEEWNQAFAEPTKSLEEKLKESRAKERERSRQEALVAQHSVPWRKLLSVACLLAALIFLVPIALDWWEERSRDLQAASASEVAEIHAILASGSWAGEDKKRVFVGEVDPSRWDVLNERERKIEAENIRDRLGHRDIKTGLIYRSGIMVINITEGQVRYIE